MVVEKLESIIYPYKLKKITMENIEEAYLLIKNNKYFDAFSKHPTTLETCIEEINSVPSIIDLSHKLYYGIYEKEKLIALIDLIKAYPTSQTMYIGLFIIKCQNQKQGLGKYLIKSLIEVLKGKEYKFIELGCYNKNEKGIKFWHKMGFKDIGINTSAHLDIQKMRFNIKGEQKTG